MISTFDEQTKGPASCTVSIVFRLPVNQTTGTYLILSRLENHVAVTGTKLLGVGARGEESDESYEEYDALADHGCDVNIYTTKDWYLDRVKWGRRLQFAPIDEK